MDKEVSAIDQISDIEFFTELVKFFGAQRTTELLGWALIAMLVTWKDPVELRKEMEARGFTKSGMYRMLRDLRRFGEHIEQRPIPVRDTVVAVSILRRAGRINSLAVSPMRLVQS